MEAIKKVGRGHIKLAITFILLNVADAALTSKAIAAGGYELNPLMRYALQYPEWIFWWVKMSAVLIITFALLLASGRFPQPIKRIFMALIVVMVVICVFNTMGLLI